MNNLKRLRLRRNKMIDEYSQLVLSNLENGILLDDGESSLLREWGLLNDKIISLKKQNVQILNASAESNGFGI